MYYIGEISDDSEHQDKVLIELWDGIPYSHLIQAERKLAEIEKEFGNHYLKIIDDKKYDVANF